jgi:DNA modification methylase
MAKDLKIQYRAIDQIVPNVRNARSHSDAQVGQLARSIEAFGFINPIIVDEAGSVVAGHARLTAAKILGLELVPTIRVDHLDEAEKRAYMLADNRHAENAGWDENLLRVELEFLTSIEIDLDVEALGFSVTEADLIIGGSQPAPADEEPPPPLRPEMPVSRVGDVWRLDNHRLVCGDCLDPEVMDTLMAGRPADMVLTDPPYNVPVAGHVSGLGRHQHAEFAMASGEMNTAQFQDFLSHAFLNLARASRDGSLHYVFMDWRHQRELIAAGQDVYAELVNVCVWVKTNGGMGSLYRSRHELVYVFRNGTKPHRNNVELGKHGRYRTNVWQYAGANAFGADRDEALAMHPTVKPVAMLADAILDVTCRNDIVLDGFLGSGSTLIAAERTGRTCYGVELDPGYVDVIIRRWQRETGQSALLEGADMDFEAVATVRRSHGEATP